jgi:dipeptidyl aminopeptidase/acylaminoacyl peptidase
MAPIKAAFGPCVDTAASRQVYGREISPIYFGTSRLPPMVIIHGDLDPTVPLQQSELLVQKARESGAPTPKLVVWPGKGHGWGDFWKSADDLKVFCDWFDKYL